MTNSLLMADVSSNNGAIDIDAYHHAGHRALAIKATEGTSYVNPYHRGQALRCGLHHMSVWHYHFARPDLGDGPTAEAEHFLRWAERLAGPRDYLVLDLERGTPQGWSHDPAWSREFDHYVQDHSRFHTILYCSRSDLQISDQWLVGRKRRVWDADWSTTRDFAPKGYSVAARQFTDGTFGPEPHAAAGIGRCDLSRVNPYLINFQ